MPSSILVFGSLCLVILGSGAPQSETLGAAPHPAILDPVVMAKATDQINSWITGGECDLAQFLSLDYWPCNLSGGNLSIYRNYTA